MMHPTYPTLSAMVAMVTIEAEHALRLPVDPQEVERYAHRVLRDSHVRPRITNYLPTLSLKQMLAPLRPQTHSG